VSAATRGTGRRHDDAGLSLTELLITMLVMSIIIVACTTLAIGFQRTNSSNVVRQDQIDVARSASEALSKTIRAAVKPSQLTTTCTACVQDAFIQAGATFVQFYANVNNTGNSVGPSRVTYAVTTAGPNTGDLVESVQRPDSNQPGASGYVYCDALAPSATVECKDRLTTRTVARRVVTSAGPLFSYYDVGGLQMVPPTGGTLAAADLDRVLSIELAVRVQNDATKAGVTTYIQRIMLPNSQAVIRQGEQVTP
jgi:Tfp pilus assembly protein PilW